MLIRFWWELMFANYMVVRERLFQRQIQQMAPKTWAGWIMLIGSGQNPYLCLSTILPQGTEENVKIWYIDTSVSETWFTVNWPADIPGVLSKIYHLGSRYIDFRWFGSIHKMMLGNTRTNVLRLSRKYRWAALVSVPSLPSSMAWMSSSTATYLINDGKKLLLAASGGC